MRRPSEREMRSTLFGMMSPVIDVMAALGVLWEELPDIIPEEPEKSPELRHHVEMLFASKGIGFEVDDFGNPTGNISPTKGTIMSAKKSDKIEEKADDALVNGVPEELKNTDPDGAGHVSPGAVFEGKADAQPVVESHKDL